MKLDTLRGTLYEQLIRPRKNLFSWGGFDEYNFLTFYRLYNLFFPEEINAQSYEKIFNTFKMVYFLCSFPVHIAISIYLGKQIVPLKKQVDRLQEYERNQFLIKKDVLYLLKRFLFILLQSYENVLVKKASVLLKTLDELDMASSDFDTKILRDIIDTMGMVPFYEDHAFVKSSGWFPHEIYKVSMYLLALFAMEITAPLLTNAFLYMQNELDVAQAKLKLWKKEWKKFYRMPEHKMTLEEGRAKLQQFLIR